MSNTKFRNPHNSRKTLIKIVLVASILAFVLITAFIIRILLKKDMHNKDDKVADSTEPQVEKVQQTDYERLVQFWNDEPTRLQSTKSTLYTLGQLLDEYDSELSDFYNSSSTLSPSDLKMEDRHFYIQWFFPNPTKSGVNSFAPILQKKESEELLKNKTYESLFERIIEVQLRFFGFSIDFANNKVSYIDSDRARLLRNNLHINGHNQLRITRILIFVKWTYSYELSQSAYYGIINKVGNPDVYDNKYKFGQRTLNIWENVFK